MDGPGTISWDEFLENAESFVQMSNQFCDGWELRGDKNIPGEAYMVRERKQFISNINDLNYFLVSENKQSTDDLNFTLKHDPFENVSPNEKPLITEHHILWSMSYSVPVLYFNGWKSDFSGINQISVEEAQSRIRGGELKYMELSQAVHPILNTPFLYLHPCMSHELLTITRTRFTCALPLPRRRYTPIGGAKIQVLKDDWLKRWIELREHQSSCPDHKTCSILTSF